MYGSHVVWDREFITGRIRQQILTWWRSWIKHAKQNKRNFSLGSYGTADWNVLLLMQQLNDGCVGALLRGWQLLTYLLW